MLLNLTSTNERQFLQCEVLNAVDFIITEQWTASLYAQCLQLRGYAV